MAKKKEGGEHLIKVLETIPLARRRALRTEIGVLCDAFGVENTFMENRAYLFSGLKSADAKKGFRRTTILKARHMAKYWIDSESAYERFPASLIEAAEIMGVTPGSLKVRVSSKTKFTRLSAYAVKQGIASNPEVFTCTKMSLDDLDEQLKIFNETVKNNPKYTNEVQ